MLYIGIDLGTSAVKLLLMDADGKIKKIASRTYDLSFPHPGWSEQNPADWYEQSIDGLKELLAECDKSRVAGISFGGQMHGLVALDERDEVIRPAIPLERRAHGRRDRLLKSGDRKGNTVGIYREYCLRRIYGAKDSLDAKA